MVSWIDELGLRATSELVNVLTLKGRTVAGRHYFITDSY